MSRYAKPERCPECGAEFKEIKTEYGGGRMLRQCKACTVRQWCDPEGRPTGTPANAFLRRARMKAHAHFDDLWRTGKMKRKEAYAWLKKELGSDKPVHIAEMTTEQCVRVAALSKVKSLELESVS